MQSQHIKILVDDKEYVGIPKDEYEDTLDVIAYDKAIEAIEKNGSDAVPSEVIDRLFLSDESPLKIWREYRGMKATELANISGQDKSYISKLENSRDALFKAGAVKIAKLAAALNISMDELVFEDN
jgi:predicted transcriptional regulator